jgi:hypothetical protein
MQLQDEQNRWTNVTEFRSKKTAVPLLLTRKNIPKNQMTKSMEKVGKGNEKLRKYL